MKPRNRHDVEGLIHALDSGETRDVTTRELLAALKGTQSIPQDILYRAPDGAKLWQDLTSSWDSSLGLVYRQFDDSGGACDKIFSMLEQQKLFSGKTHQKLGVLALGCGDAMREYSICNQLIKRDRARKIEVVLLDTARELVVAAKDRFAGLPPEKCNIQLAYCDFFDVVTMKALRKTYFGDIPVLALMIGNTLGNIDEKEMLASLSDILHPGDVLVVEALSHDSNNLPKCGEYPADDDSRASFITNPLRLLIGGQPDIRSLSRRTEIVGGGDLVSHTYMYQFNSSESGLRVRDSDRKEHKIRSNTTMSLLQIKSMSSEYLESAMNNVMGNVSVTQHLYPIHSSNDIMLVYGCGVRGAESGHSVSGGPKTQLEIGNYGELAIGIMSDGYCYAFNQRSVVSNTFKKRDGIEFRLRTDTYLHKLIHTLAQSSSGKQISIKEAAPILLRELMLRAAEKQRVDRAELHNVSKKYSAPDDQEGVIEFNSRSQISMSQHNLLSERIADLGRKLRDKLATAGVVCANRNAIPILSSSLDEDRVSSAVLFGFLVQDGSRRSRFVNETSDAEYGEPWSSPDK